MNFGINVSPVSGKVYIGRLDKKRTCFLEKEEMPKAHAVEMAIEILKSEIQEGSSGTVYESSQEVVEFTVSKPGIVHTSEDELRREIEMKISNLEAQKNDILENHSDELKGILRSEIRQMKIDLLKDVLALGTTKAQEKLKNSSSETDA